MKKFLFKSLLTAAACFLGVGNGYAVEYETIYSWNFNVAADENVTVSSESVTVAGTTCYLGTGTTDGLAFQTGSGVWKIYKNNTGLRNVNNGDPRYLVILNVKKDDIITVNINVDAASDLSGISGTYADGVYTWTVTETGNVGAKILRAGGKIDDVQVWPSITQITVKREKSDKPIEPTGSIVAVNGNSRTVALSTKTADCTIYYTTDGTDPTTGSTEYAAPGVVIDTNTTIKAIAEKGGFVSDVYTGEFEAGTTISVATPSYWVKSMKEGTGVYYPEYNASSDNSSVLCKPEITVTATFNGSAVTLPYAATETGTLVFTASATGYDSAESSVVVKAYTKYLSYDFKNLTAGDLDTGIWGEAITGILGSNTQWGSSTGNMTAEQVHYNLSTDESLSTAFPGITLGKSASKEGSIQYPSLYIGYGIIWTSLASNNIPVSVTNPVDDAIMEVTTNGGYGKSLSTWYQIGNSVSIYRFDTALENLVVYAPSAQTLDVTAAGWATLAPASDVVIPAGVEAYYVSALNAEGTSATLTALPAGTAIKANEGIIVNAAEGTYNFPKASTTPEALDNLLSGTQVEIAKPATGTTYVLGPNNETGVVGLCQYTGATLAAGKAYMHIAAGAPAFISFGEDGTTGIDAVAVEAEADGVMYNVMGQIVGPDYKGLVIKNGRKFYNR